MSTNISEFERTKPTETLKAINALQFYVQSALETSTTINPYQILTEVYIRLNEIKRKFKAGE